MRQGRLGWLARWWWPVLPPTLVSAVGGAITWPQALGLGIGLTAVSLSLGLGLRLHERQREERERAAGVQAAVDVIVRRSFDLTSALKRLFDAAEAADGMLDDGAPIDRRELEGAVHTLERGAEAYLRQLMGYVRHVLRQSLGSEAGPDDLGANLLVRCQESPDRVVVVARTGDHEQRSYLLDDEDETVPFPLARQALRETLEGNWTYAEDVLEDSRCKADLRFQAHHQRHPERRAECQSALVIQLAPQGSWEKRGLWRLKKGKYAAVICIESRTPGLFVEDRAVTLVAVAMPYVVTLTHILTVYGRAWRALHAKGSPQGADGSSGAPLNPVLGAQASPGE